MVQQAASGINNASSEVSLRGDPVQEGAEQIAQGRRDAGRGGRAGIATIEEQNKALADLGSAAERAGRNGRNTRVVDRGQQERRGAAGVPPKSFRGPSRRPAAQRRRSRPRSSRWPAAAEEQAAATEVSSWRYRRAPARAPSACEELADVSLEKVDAIQKFLETNKIEVDNLIAGISDAADSERPLRREHPPAGSFGRAHRQDCRCDRQRHHPDQPAGSQRRHRGGARWRLRSRLCRRVSRRTQPGQGIG